MESPAALQSESCLDDMRLWDLLDITEPGHLKRNSFEFYSEPVESYGF